MLPAPATFEVYADAFASTLCFLSSSSCAACWSAAAPSAAAFLGADESFLARKLVAPATTVFRENFLEFVGDVDAGAVPGAGFDINEGLGGTGGGACAGII